MAGPGAGEGQPSCKQHEYPQPEIKHRVSPPDQLPGDANMPRVAGPKFGQSERLTVSPGREEEGLYDMPGGQGGHPLSPYFLRGHAAWFTGTHGQALLDAIRDAGAPIVVQ